MAIQRKYAEDNPADFGKGPLTSADKANKIIDAKANKARDTNWGTWGASGTPGKKKFYSDGVISSNAYTTPKGHYILGLSRRRIGAGFGLRRRFVDTKKVPVKKAEIKKAEKGHAMLKEMGKVQKNTPGKVGGTASSSDADEIVKGMDKKTAAAYKMMRAATAPTPAPGTPGTPSAKAADAKAAAKEYGLKKPTLPKGVVEANKKYISPNDARILKATGAGKKAEMDKSGHFEKVTDVKIIGKKETKVLTNGGTEEMSQAEVTELLQDMMSEQDAW